MAKLTEKVTMNKEKVITIVIGLLVGAIIAGGYFYWTKVLSKNVPTLPTNTNKQTQTNGQKSDTTSNTNSKDDPLTLSTPEDNSSTAEETISVKGKAPANAKIVFYTNADEKIASASADGSFETTVKLETGQNVISVTAFEANGTMHNIMRNVTMEASQ